MVRVMIRVRIRVRIRVSNICSMDFLILRYQDGWNLCIKSQTVNIYITLSHDPV